MFLRSRKGKKRLTDKRSDLVTEEGQDVSSSQGPRSPPPDAGTLAFAGTLCSMHSANIYRDGGAGRPVVSKVEAGSTLVDRPSDGAGRGYRPSK